MAAKTSKGLRLIGKMYISHINEDFGAILLSYFLPVLTLQTPFRVMIQETLLW